MISDRTLFIISCLGGLIPIFYYIETPLTQEKTSSGPRVVVGVLSKLDNFERRRAVRATWRKMLPENVHFSFILGDTFCPYHELWRLSDDSCDEWKLEVRVYSGN